MSRTKTEMRLRRRMPIENLLSILTHDLFSNVSTVLYGCLTRYARHIFPNVYFQTKPVLWFCNFVRAWWCAVVVIFHVKAYGVEASLTRYTILLSSGSKSSKRMMNDGETEFHGGARSGGSFDEWWDLRTWFCEFCEVLECVRVGYYFFGYL